MSSMERRRAQRFKVELPVVVRWREGSETRESVTVSQDVSSNGIYFILPHGIKDGTPVEVEMTMPHQVTLAGPLRVRCMGHIQRCQLEDGFDAHIAAAIEKYEFLPDSKESVWKKED